LSNPENGGTSRVAKFSVSGWVSQKTANFQVKTRPWHAPIGAARRILHKALRSAAGWVRRVVPLLDRRVKRVHVHMQNDPKHVSSAILEVARGKRKYAGPAGMIAGPMAHLSFFGKREIRVTE
jgi:hypothetical protein